MKSNTNFGKFGAKGYYIALILCAAAIGISGYVYYRNATDQDPQLQDPTVDIILPTQGDLPVVGTEPGQQTGGNDQLQTPTTPDAPTQPQVLTTCAPLEGTILSPYAMECLAYNQTTRDWRTHDGIDIAAEAGTPVCAAANGTVYTTYQDDTMGTTVVIRHAGGYVTVYASLSEDVPVKAGDIVTMGQTIGYVGHSALLETAIGDHLHFSVTCNDVPLDPEDFFNLE